MAERKKTVAAAVGIPKKDILERLEHYSSYNTQIRIVVYVVRYMENLKQRKCLRTGSERLQPQNRRVLEATADEISRAEMVVLRHVQRRNFIGEGDAKLKKLAVFQDENGLLRTKTQLYYGCDDMDIRCPVVLPSKDPIVKSLVMAAHEENGHVGVQTLLALLREKFWILDGRRAINTVIGRCLKCRRFAVKRCQVQTPPLPMDRVTTGKTFEVTGVDLLGPLYLYHAEKVWVVLFTCAVYRSVHLEVTKTLSTAGFLMALRRFVARRGRPSKVYSDNGLNFVGCSNLFREVDWVEVTKYANVRQIKWIFNPPTAAWWGGWWERLVGLTKGLLRRILGKRVVSLEELTTILCEVEDGLNQRPLTYLSEKDDLVPLRPILFLRDNGNCGLPEADCVDGKLLRGSARRVQHLRDQLRNRIKKEYLVQLRHVMGTKNVAVKTGDVVLIEHDDKKRIDWPWGVVKETFPGRDGRIRAAMVRTVDGQYLRPIQRLFLLEVTLEEKSEQVETMEQVTVGSGGNDGSEKAESVPEQVTTRAGRKIKKPDRFNP